MNGSHLCSDLIPSSFVGPQRVLSPVFPAYCFTYVVNTRYGFESVFFKSYVTADFTRFFIFTLKKEVSNLVK